MSRLVVRTVVGSEHDQRVLIDLQFFEQVKDILGVDLLGTLSSTGVK